MLAAYERAAQPFKYQVYEAPANDSAFWCLKENPSCSRDAWWVEWNELQDRTPVQFRFLGPGLVVEKRFVEAIMLLWQWPEGKGLLKDAASQSVHILAAPPRGEYFGVWVQPLNAIGINRLYTETSTWMVADILAHELTHAADRHAGRFQNETYSDCITLEQRAFHAELRYLTWLNGRFGLPDPPAVHDRLTREDFLLYEDLFSTVTSSNLDADVDQLYKQKCS